MSKFCVLIGLFPYIPQSDWLNSKTYTANVNPEEIVVPGKPRVYDGKQGDVTFQIQCHCRNKNCAFAGYTLPPCMAARKTTSAIRGRSMNRNPIDLFKYVPGPFSDLLTNKMNGFIESAIN